MATKVHAAEIALAKGIDTYIINGAQPQAIYALLDGKPVGTHFKAVK